MIDRAGQVDYLNLLAIDSKQATVVTHLNRSLLIDELNESASAAPIEPEVILPRHRTGERRTLIMKADQIWQAAQGELQLQMTRATYDTWVKPTSVLSYEDGAFAVAVPNAYTQEWWQNRLTTTVKRILTGIVGHSVDVRFVVWAKEEKSEGVSLLNGIEPAPRPTYTAEPSSNGRTSSGLNPKYIFDTFVVGSSNRLAHAACLAVAERPAAQYNPLFLYGGVGLGKTHLLHAIGHVCAQNNLQVLYVSSEEFTNELINAIRAQNTAAFRDKYRTIDVLLVDDIQFIAGKESTQEEFFHTFNALHGNGKQIVMTSDRPPKSMVTLEERLRSRFEWGLTADIQLPDLETRTAILRDKAENQGLPVPSAVLDLIARQVQSNIRELEGALNRVLAHARLTGSPLTVETAASALADLMARPSNVTFDELLMTVSSFFNVPRDELLGRSRNKETAHPRQVVMYLAREELQLTLPQIGEALGGRDHTTIMYGVEKVGESIDKDDGLRRDILTIRERLYNRNGVAQRIQ